MAASLGSIEAWSIEEQHIIEDSVMFNPRNTLAVMKELGYGLMRASEILVGLQGFFPQFDEESQEMVSGSGMELDVDDLRVIGAMLSRSLFFTHDLHNQKHLDSLAYLNAAQSLDQQFGVTIPC